MGQKTNPTKLQRIGPSVSCIVRWQAKPVATLMGKKKAFLLTAMPHLCRNIQRSIWRENPSHLCWKARFRYRGSGKTVQMGQKMCGKGQMQCLESRRRYFESQFSRIKIGLELQPPPDPEAFWLVPTGASAF